MLKEKKKFTASVLEPTVSKISLGRWSYCESQSPPPEKSHHFAIVKPIYLKKMEVSKPPDST